jgi:AraC-like DNA-binding protein
VHPAREQSAQRPAPTDPDATAPDEPLSPSVPPSLLVLDSHGTHAIEETWRQVVPSARLETADPRRFRLGWRSVTLEGFSLVQYELTASVQSMIEPDDQFMACRVATGDGWVRNTRRDLDPASPWMSIDGTTRARWRGSAHVRAFVFDRTYAIRTARQISGDDRLVLRADDGAPRSRAAGEQWERAFRHLATSLFLLASDDDDTDLLQAELRRHALRTTLLTFPSTLSGVADNSAQRRSAPRTVRRAIAYLEEHAHEAITIDDAAAAAGISTRGLQYAFRRAMEMTPTEYLRTVRLSGAHEELRRGGATTVGEVSKRWGFTSASRFARQYREAYGQNPSRTRRTA